MDAGGLRACVVWHRRAGKDDVSLRWTFKAAQQRIGGYWHMLPQAEQARKAIWEAVNPHTGKKRIDEAFPIAARKRTRANEMFIEFKNGSTWQVVGSDNYNALVGSPPVGIVFSEWALADPAAWAYLSPILRENKGWAVFIYTPRGRNHGLSTFEVAKANSSWFWEKLSAEDTTVFTAEDLATELRERMQEFGPDLGRAYFDQEFLCSFDAAILGAIYSAYIRRAEREGRIGVVPYDPGYPVNTAWDLGYSDSTSVWFWQLCPGPEIRLIDYLENSGRDPHWYAEQILGRKIETVGHRVTLGALLPDVGYRSTWSLGKHYVPHDAAHKVLAAGGRSFGDQMHDYGIECDVIDATNQMDQITAARKTLEFCWIDKAHCQRGIEALESYHFAWDEKGRTLKTIPVHDWASHGSDALEIIGQVWQAPRRKVLEEPTRFLHEATADEVFWGPREHPYKPLERI